MLCIQIPFIRGRNEKERKIEREKEKERKRERERERLIENSKALVVLILESFPKTKVFFSK